MTAYELALEHGACTHPVCTNARRTTFHMDPVDCPYGRVATDLPQAALASEAAS